MNNSQATFDEIYDAHYLEIKKFIFTIARRDESITDDIFQNTWENAYRYFHTLKDVDSTRAWLYSIARNETKRWFSQKTNKLFTEVSSIDAEDAIEIPDESEIDFPEALANADFLREAINKLSEEEQQLIILNYYYDVSLKEISSMYGINYNTIKSLTRRALAKLRSVSDKE